MCCIISVVLSDRNMRSGALSCAKSPTKHADQARNEVLRGVDFQ